MMHRNRKPRPRQTTSRSTLLESLETRRLMSTITFNGTSGNDSFVLKAGGPNDVIVYNGKGGNDSIKVQSTGSIGTVLSDVKLLNSNGGTWAVQIDSTTAGGKRNVVVGDGKVVGVTHGAVDYSQTKLRTLTVNALGSAGSTAAIDQTPATTLNSFNLQGSWNATVGGAAGKLDGIKNPIQINAASGKSKLHINDLGDGADHDVTLTGTQLSGLSPKPIAYSGFDTLSVLAGSGDKKIAVKGTSAQTTFTSFDGTNTVKVGDNGNFDKLNRNLKIATIYGESDLTFDRSKDTLDRTWTINDHSVNTNGINALLTYSGKAAVHVLTGSGRDKVVVNSTNSSDFSLNTGAGNDDVVIFAAKGRATIDAGTHPASYGFSDNVRTNDGTKGSLSWFPKGLTIKNADIAGFSDISDWTPHHYALVPGGLVRDGVKIVTFSGEKRVALLGGGGNDVMDASGFDSPVLLEGLMGNDFIRGTALADNLEGKQGNDTIIGGGGNDLVFGEEGNDLLNVTGNGTKTHVDGGTGYDTTRFDGELGTLTNVESLKYPGLITGSVFSDGNKNGVWNAGETGKAGVQVWLDLNHSGTFDYGDSSAFTDSDGKYTLRDLDPGQYSVNVLPPVGFKQTDHGGKPYTVLSGVATSSYGINFGVAKK